MCRVQERKQFARDHVKSSALPALETAHKEYEAAVAARLAAEAAEAKAESKLEEALRAVEKSAAELSVSAAPPPTAAPSRSGMVVARKHAARRGY